MGCKKHLKIKGNRNYYFKTIGYCSRTKVKSSLMLRGFYATWPWWHKLGWCSLCRDLGTFVKPKNNQLCDYMTTERTRLTGIPVLWCRDAAGNFPSSHACQTVRWMNHSRTRTTGNTPLVRIASNPYIKMVAPDWLGSCNTGIKVTSLRHMQLGPHCELYCHAVCTWKNWNILKFGLDPGLSIYASPPPPEKNSPAATFSKFVEKERPPTPG